MWVGVVGDLVELNTNTQLYLTILRCFKFPKGAIHCSLHPSLRTVQEARAVGEDEHEHGADPVVEGAKEGRVLQLLTLQPELRHLLLSLQPVLGTV